MAAKTVVSSIYIHGNANNADKLQKLPLKLPQCQQNGNYWSVCVTYSRHYAKVSVSPNITEDDIPLWQGWPTHRATVPTSAASFQELHASEIRESCIPHPPVYISNMIHRRCTDIRIWAGIFYQYFSIIGHTFCLNIYTSLQTNSALEIFMLSM